MLSVLGMKCRLLAQPLDSDFPPSLRGCFPPLAAISDPLRTAAQRLDPAAMDPLYVLLHSLPETGKVKVIGIYSSKALAEAAETRARLLPGFADESDGFTIEQYEVDEDHWPRGFVRL